MVRWLRWHCPPDTGFEIRALAVWGRARYLSVTEAPHNTNFHTWMGKMWAPKRLQFLWTTLHSKSMSWWRHRWFFSHKNIPWPLWISEILRCLAYIHQYHDINNILVWYVKISDEPKWKDYYSFICKIVWLTEHSNTMSWWWVVTV